MICFLIEKQWRKFIILTSITWRLFLMLFYIFISFFIHKDLSGTFFSLFCFAKNRVKSRVREWALEEWEVECDCMLRGAPRFISVLCFDNKKNIRMKRLHKPGKHINQNYDMKRKIRSSTGCHKLHWPTFLKLFQNSRRRAHYSDSFFPTEYEYLSHLFSQHVQTSQNFMSKVRNTS